VSILKALANHPIFASVFVMLASAVGLSVHQWSMACGPHGRCRACAEPWLATGGAWSSATAAAAKDVPTEQEAKKLKELLTQRCDALKELAEYYSKNLKQGTYPYDRNVYEAFRSLHLAELELCEKQADRTAASQRFLDMAKDAEAQQEKRSKAGAPSISFPLAKAARIEAEIGLLRAKEKPVSMDLKKERRDALQETVDIRVKQLMAGVAELDRSFFEIVKDLTGAELEVREKESERIEACQKISRDGQGR
jgi:hypothetical protein